MNRSGISKTLSGLVAGAGAGAALMYFLDPSRGRRRRAIAGDKLTSFARKVPPAVRVTGRDISNRLHGVLAETRGLFSSDQPEDQVLEARVRSKMGRVVSHPGAITVSVNDGSVKLSGPILADEVTPLIGVVQRVSGVADIENALDVHESPEGVSALQGGRDRKEVSAFRQEHWSPTARVAAGTAGTAAIALGVARRDPISIGFGALGAAMLARSATNRELTDLVWPSGEASPISVERTLNIGIPVETVTQRLSNLEGFFAFATDLIEIRDKGDGFTHWKIKGPAGVPVEWDARITKYDPEKLISWQSADDAVVQSEGYVLFEPAAENTTDVSFKLNFTPPGGPIGEALAKAFGTDGDAKFDEELENLKRSLESGKEQRKSRSAAK